MKTVLIINEGVGKDYTQFFEKLGYKVRHGSKFPTDYKPDLICLTGGTDVYPELYGEKKRPETSFPDAERDQEELDVYCEAVDAEVPVLGICRGAQFICVMNNGRLVQHVIGHGRPHLVVNNEGEEFEVSSSHHQMMVPDDDGEIIAYSKGLSPRYLGDDYQHTMDKEPEAVYWESARSLGVQWHPEWMSENERGFEIVKEWIDTLLLKENLCEC